MTNDSPRYIALKSGALVSLALTVVYIIIVLVGGEKINLAKCAILALVAFFTSYGSFLFIFDRVLKRQIQKIYETIEKLDSSKLELEGNNDLNEDVLGGVSEVVMNWAELKSKEIEDLKKLENYRREFLGNVSHELKTPIFNIQGYLLTLLDGALNDDKVRNRYLEKAAFNIDRLSHIVQDLESISMLESGALKIDPGTFKI